MKNKFTKARFLSVLFISSVLVGNMTAMVSAEDNETEIVESSIVIDDLGEYPTDEELLMGYFEKELYSDVIVSEDSGIYENSISASAPVMMAELGPDMLSAGELELYEAACAEIKNIAAGKESSATVIIPQVEFSYEELGLTSTATTKKINTAINAMFKKVYKYLLIDLPYELYWHDKTIGAAGGYSYTYDGTTVTATNFTFKFAVASDYCGADSYTADTTKTGAATTAAANAKAIVDNNASKGDVEKLTAYKDAIHELVTYDDAAADSSPSVLGIDPWQLIHVFDGDPDTNVVCEGYSKAFQHLCNLSTFNGTVECYNVSGKMSGGPHMWNIVTIGKRNYLVDITNTDEGTIGSPDQLFLKGVAGSYSAGYTRTIGSESILFKYDADSVDYYGEKILTLSYEDYSADLAEEDVDITDTGAVIWANGAKIKQPDKTYLDYKSAALETDLTATNWINNKNKTVKGKLVWTTRLTPDEPSFDTAKHTVVTKADKTVASVSSKGVVTPKSGGETGESVVYIFASDTGAMESEGFKVTVKNAASTIMLFDDASKTDKKQILKNITLVAGGDSARVYVTPSAKQGKVHDDCTYTVSAAKNNGVVEFTQLSKDENGRYYFDVAGLKVEKIGKASVITVNVTCDQSNKKASLKVSVTAPTTDINAEAAPFEEGGEAFVSKKGDKALLNIEYIVEGTGEYTTDAIQVAVCESDPVVDETGKKVTMKKSKLVTAALDKTKTVVTLKASKDVTAEQGVYFIMTNAVTKVKTVYKVADIGTDGAITPC